MDHKKQNFSEISDEDFENLDSSSESSTDEQEDETESDSDQSDEQISKNKKNKKKPIKKPKKSSKVRIIFNVSDTQYDVVKFVGKKVHKWKLSYLTETMNWDVMWTDNAVLPETLARMQTYQKINHFPGMYSLARKNHLGRNLMRMKKAFPENYKFFPQTFLLPSEYGDFKMQFDGKNKKTFIVKPEASCQGRGIFLTRTWESVQPGEHYVVQKYLEKPFLIDGLKFDMRIYVLLAGCDPLKIFLFNDGLGRFCTEEYIAPSGDNLENMCMHLTNYAINKDNENFIFNESSSAGDVGHKRSLKAVFKTLKDRGHDVDKLWKEIKKIIIKTFCSVQPILAHNYRSCHPDEPFNNMCFELLGFDIILDHKLNPWLLEVNHTPSFTTDTPLDKTIKKNAIKDALKIMNISVENKIQAKNKKKIELQQRVLTGKKMKLTAEEKQIAFENAQKQRDVWEAENCGGYTKIFPLEDYNEMEEDYEEFMKVSKNWWEEWTGMSIKRNTKKVSDPNKPPPMIFGQGSSTSATRIKELQTSFVQKMKTSITPTSKPGSSQNVRTTKFAFNQCILPNQTRKSTTDISSSKKLIEDKIEKADKEFIFENKELADGQSIDLLPETPREIKGKETILDKRGVQILKPLPEVVRANLKQIEEKIDDHDGDSEGERRDTFHVDLPEFRKSDLSYNTGFKNLSKSVNFSSTLSIKTNTTREMQELQKRHLYKSPSQSDETRMQLPKQLIIQRENPLELIQPRSMKHLSEKVAEIREKELISKKVPLKLSTPIVGGLSRPREESWSQSIGPVAFVLRSIEAERNAKNITNLTKRTNGVNEVKGLALTRKVSPSFTFSSEKPSGSFVSPKVFEIDVQSNERITKPKMMLEPSSPKINLVNQSGATKFRTYQKVLTPNFNQYLESNMSLQKLIGFLTSSNPKK